MAGSAAHDAGSGVRDISELLGREPHALLCRATNARMVGEREADRSHREIEPLSDVFYCDHGVRLVLPQNSSIGERGTLFPHSTITSSCASPKKLDSMSCQS